jgi:hypothetical protein
MHDQQPARGPGVRSIPVHSSTGPTPRDLATPIDADDGVRVVHVRLDDARRSRPQRPLPADLEAWAQGLPLPSPFARLGVAATLRATLLRCWRAVEASFALGITVREGANGRDVVLCGAQVYRIAAGGAAITTHVLDGHGRARDKDLEVLRPLPDWRWVHDVLATHAGLMRDLRRGLEAQGRAGVISPPQAIELSRDAWRWIGATIERMARRRFDRRVMQSRLRAALAIDPELVALARRVHPHDGTAAWFTRVAAWRRTGREIARIAPGLLPLFGAWIAASCPGARRALEPPLAILQRELRQAGATPMDWCFLLTDPARPIWRLVRAGRIRGLADIVGFLASWARVHRGLPADLRFPSALWEPLCAICIDPADDRVRPSVRWPFGPEITAEAIRRWREAARVGRGEAFVAGDFGLLVRWAADYADEGRTHLRSWRNATARAREHDRRKRAAAATAAARPWRFPRTPQPEGPWIVVPLRTPLDLVEEAIAMHHCVDQRVADCDSGRTRIYGIRRRDDGARLATLEVRWSARRGSPRLVELRGLLNRPAPEPVRAFAKRVVASLGPWYPSVGQRR